MLALVVAVASTACSVGAAVTVMVVAVRMDRRARKAAHDQRNALAVIVANVDFLAGQADQPRSG